MYSNYKMSNEKKKSFRLLLDTNRTASYSGSKQFDAVFNVDLSKILRPEDYDKAYEMTFSFRSISSPSATSGISMDDTYELAVDLTKGVSCWSSAQAKFSNIVGILRVENDFTSYTISGGTTTTATYLCSCSSDNSPTYVPNLLGIQNVRLTVVQASNAIMFNTSDNATVNTATKYICILNFKEI